MKTANEKTALKFYDLFNKRDWQALSSICDDKITLKNMATGEDYKGVDGAKKWLQSWSNLCTDMKCDDVEAVATSDTFVVIEGNAHGNNDGPIHMATANLPASHKKLHVQWVDIIEMHGGKISSVRSYYDTGRVMTQLGVAMNPPAARPTPGVAR